jgi:hypothetical protein
MRSGRECEDGGHDEAREKAVELSARLACWNSCFCLTECLAELGAPRELAHSTEATETED